MDDETSYTPTEAQAVAAIRDRYFDLLRRRRTLAKALIFSLGAGATFLLLSWEPGDAPRRLSISFALGAAFGAVGFVPVWALSYLLLAPRARRLFRQINAREGVYKWKWDRDGFELTTPNGNARFAWAELHRIATGRHAFLLFLHDRHYLALPRGVLTPAQEKSFAAASGADGGVRA
jgi:hypothetical protein